MLNYMLAQDTGAGIAGILFLVIYLAVIIVVIAGVWKTFEKAGQPGWAILVPFYNLVVMLKVAGKPLWWFVLFLLPFISIIPAIIVPLEIAKRFGKGSGFGVGLIFLPFIFYPILGFGEAEYNPAEVQYA